MYQLKKKLLLLLNVVQINVAHPSNYGQLLIHSNLCKQYTDVIEFWKVKDIFEVADLNILLDNDIIHLCYIRKDMYHESVRHLAEKMYFSQSICSI